MSPAWRTEDGRPAVWLNLLAFAAALILALFGLALLAWGKALDGVDARAYWTAWSHGLYPPGTSLVGDRAFLYSPAFAQAIWPLTLLPSWAFRAVDSGACAMAFWWLTGPLPWRLRAPILIACLPSIVMGNVQALVLVAAVAGLRHPALWALPLLTKITPGVGLLWFAGRRDWRALGLAAGSTALCAGASFALDPVAWARWLEVLRENLTVYGSSLFLPGVLPAIPITVRLTAAAALAGWGGLRDRPWTVIGAIFLAQPDAGIDTLLMLAAALPRTLIGPGARLARPSLGPERRERSRRPLLSSGA